MEPKTKWQRVEISTCFCNALNKAHVHCLCIHCEYSTVSSSTEYRHWKEFETYFDHFSSQNTTDEDIDIELTNFGDVNLTVCFLTSLCLMMMMKVPFPFRKK